MDRFQTISQFIPVLKPFSRTVWHGKQIIQGPDGSVCALSGVEPPILALISSQKLTIGTLNEKIYEETGRISPLAIVRFLVKLEKSGFLENSGEFRDLMPEKTIKAPRLKRGRFLFSIKGLNTGFGIALPLLMAGAAGFLGSRIRFPVGLSSISAVYTPSNPLALIFLYPLLCWLLYALRGVLSILFFLLSGKTGFIELYTPLGIPFLRVKPESVISSDRGDRLGFLLSYILMFPLCGLLLFGFSNNSDLVESLVVLLFLCAFFDFSLLRESPALRLIEELSGEIDLSASFKLFWKNRFATVRSLGTDYFRKEELYYGLGLFQLIWFITALLLVSVLIPTLFSETMPLALQHGMIRILPSLEISITIVLALAFTILPFLLRKTAVLTFSLGELGKGLSGPGVREKTGRTVSIDSIPVFSSADSEEQKRIQEAAETVTVKKGRIILRKGDPGSELYAILNGRCSVYSDEGPGEEQPLAILREGDVFGERALFGEGIRTANVRALTHMSLAVIPGDLFLALAETDAEKSEIARIIKTAHRVRNTEIFSDLPSSLLIELAAAAETLTFESGKSIITEGGTDTSFFILDSGEALVSKADKKGDILLCPGAHFGELALLNNSPRTATVQAQTDCSVFMFTKEVFVRTVFSHFESLLRLETEGLRRQAEKEGGNG